MHRSRLRSERARTFVFPSGYPTTPEDEARFFQAEGGERCALLDQRWEEMLEAIGALGPLAIILHNTHLRLAAMTRRLEFHPEPGGTTVVELLSGLMIDPSDWAYALAVQEPIAGGCTLGLQFFDHHGAGQLKLLLTREANPEAFFALVAAHATGGYPPEIEELTREPEPPAAAPTLPGRRTLRRLWRVTRHETGGRFFPGLPGVARLSVMRHVGQAYARPVSFDELAVLLGRARDAALPLRMTLFSQGATHAICCLPRTIESCCRGLHLFDSESEFHLFPDEETLFWIIAKGEHYAVEIIATDGRRLGLIESMAMPIWQRTWARLVCESGQFNDAPPSPY